jgi:transcriptional regulator with XRE-family HTH domain
MANAHPLTKARTAVRWTQTRLAVEADVAQSTISFVENGERGGKFSPESAAKILAALKRGIVVAKKHRVDTSAAERLRLEDLVFPRGEAKA